MNNDFMPGADPEEVKHFLHGLGLIPLNEYYSKIVKNSCLFDLIFNLSTSKTNVKTTNTKKIS